MNYFVYATFANGFTGGFGPFDTVSSAEDCAMELAGRGDVFGVNVVKLAPKESQEETKEDTK